MKRTNQNNYSNDLLDVLQIYYNFLVLVLANEKCIGYISPNKLNIYRNLNLYVWDDTQQITAQ